MGGRAPEGITGSGIGPEKGGQTHGEIQGLSWAQGKKTTLLVGMCRSVGVSLGGYGGEGGQTENWR